MKLIGIVRLGRDAEQRYTSDGTPVLSFSGAFNFGRKDAEGKRPSQWVEFTMWGERGEKLVPYLLKGAQVFVSASEPNVQTFEKRDGGSGVKLVARVDDLQLIGGKADGGERGAPAPANPPAARPSGKAPASTGTGFDDLADDIPF